MLHSNNLGVKIDVISTHFDGFFLAEVHALIHMILYPDEEDEWDGDDKMASISSLYSSIKYSNVAKLWTLRGGNWTLRGENCRVLSNDEIEDELQVLLKTYSTNGSSVAPKESKNFIEFWFKRKISKNVLILSENCDIKL